MFFKTTPRVLHLGALVSTTSMDELTSDLRQPIVIGQVKVSKIAVVNPRRACAARVTVVVVCVCVCLSICLSVKSHLTSGTSVRLENAVTHSAGNEGGVFSETASFQNYGTSCIVRLQCSRPFSLGGICACASKTPR